MQIEMLGTEDPNTICAYPTTETMQSHVDVARYEGRPFTRRLALAEAQLTPVFFELSVLERYFNDPRFEFRFLDYEGSIVVSSDHYEDENMPERDKILLETFGIGYDQDRNRLVVYLRYLSMLSPEHQQSWNAQVVGHNCTMNSDYERATIYGEWPSYYSIYHAFLTEQAEINKLCGLIGKPPLFKETYEGGTGPMGFSRCCVLRNRISSGPLTCWTS